MRDRHQQIYAKHEWQAEPQYAVTHKHRTGLSLQVGPDEKTGKKKHERHQEDVLRGAKQVETQPSLIIDERGGLPSIWRAIEGRLRRGLGGNIGKHGMECDNEQNHACSQIADCRDRFGH